MIVGLVTGATLIMTSLQNVKDFFTSFVGRISEKIFENIPVKEFEKRENVISLIDEKVGLRFLKIAFLITEILY